MPVQMVCDSTSLVSAALRDSLSSSSTNPSPGSGIGGTSSMSAAPSSATGDGGHRSSGTSLFGASSSRPNSEFLEPDDDCFDLGNKLTSVVKYNQLTPVRYEEVPGRANEVDNLKSKYIVLNTTATTSNTLNGFSNSVGGAGKVNGSATNTSGVLMNGGSSAGITTKSANDSLSNGTSTGSSYSNQLNAKDQLPVPKRTLFQREEVQLGWKATGHRWNVGAGMINVGNTCYLNSTLQALFHVPAIANWLLSDSAHREKCNENGGQGSCIICAMAKTLIASQENQHSAIKPHLVYTKLQMVCKHLVLGRQEDAHEFLRYLVEAMEKSYLSRSKNSKDLDQYSKETTPLNQILGGYLRSEVKCLSCQHISTTFQHFEDLLLDIRKVNSIDEALHSYFAKERLEENQYKCEACKKRVAATKQFYLERAPFVLCIQLKRFSMLGGKINKHVELRARLDLTPYIRVGTSTGRQTYKLVSMVTHLGNTQHCGHYTAIGTTETGNYYVFDDTCVRSISVQNVTSTNAYIIFYELESVQNGAKSNATSTATLSSFGNATGSSASKIGSSGGTVGNTAGRVPANPSPLRTVGSGVNPLLPNKLEPRSNFIGPVLPQQQAQEKTKKLVNGVTSHPFLGDDRDQAMNSTRLSPPSSTTSTLSSPSPVKSNSNSLNSPVGGKLGRNPASHSPSVAKDKFGITTSSSGNSSYKSSPTSFTTPSALPSMPQICNNSSVIKSTGWNRGDSSPVGFSSSPSKNPSQLGACTSSSYTNTNINNVHKNMTNGNKTVASLVPYEDDDDDDPEDELMKRHNSGRNPHADQQPNENIDRTHPRAQLNPTNKKQLSPPLDEDSSCSPKSPPVIKTKTGLWKVSDNRPQVGNSAGTSSAGSSAHTSKSTTPSTSGGSSPANYGMSNGHTSSGGGGGGPLASGYQANSRPTNGYNNNNYNNGYNNRNRNDDVTAHLQSYSHQGFGAQVRTWNNQQTYMDQELALDRREDRKRQLADDRDTEMDRGRVKKNKLHCNNNSGGSSMNLFQSYQNQYNNGMGSGGGGGINGRNPNHNRKWTDYNGGNKYYNKGHNFQKRNNKNYGNHARNHNGFRHNRQHRNNYQNNNRFNNNHHYQNDSSTPHW